MKTRSSTRSWLAISISVAALGYFLYTYPSLYPHAAVHLSLTRDEIRDKAGTLVRGLGYDISGLRESTSFYAYEDRVAHLERKFGSEKANRLLADSIPGFYWEIRWRRKNVKLDSIGDKDERAREEVNEALFGDIKVKFDPRGNALQFETNRDEKPDHMPKKPPDRRTMEEEAGKLADSLFQALTGKEPGWNRVKPASRPEPFAQTFHRERVRPVAGLTEKLEIQVRHGKVASFHRFFDVPKAAVPFSKQKDLIETLWPAALCVFFIVLGIVILIKRLRQDLIDIKSGWFAGLLVFVGWTLTYWNSSQWKQNWWGMALGFVFTVPFVTGGAWLVWVLGESLTRESWGEKLVTADLFRKRFVFPDLGKSLIQGLALALACLGLHAFCCDLALRWTGGGFHFGGNDFGAFGFRFPVQLPLADAFLSMVYAAVTVGFFLLAFLKRTVKKKGWMAFIAVWFCMPFGFSLPNPSFPYGYVIHGLLGLACILFYFRTDWVALLTGMVMLPVLFWATAFFHTGTDALRLHGALLFLLVLLVAVWALASLRAKPVSVESVRYVPEYVQRLYEKERLQRELEIARNVQMNFLPRIQPQVQGISIASFCIPAREVGGDYFDFVNLGPKKLGVVIGDVSGKGIPAAFYMTMTKGFLQSQARILSSPRDVLVNLNSLFYENAERGMFISMIYGVFDLSKRTLTFARAGHNPMIVKHSGGGKVEELASNGIALGLESGPLFNKQIEEKRLHLKKGDLFFFYTDGLNEAKNRFQEEFGETRLKNAVEAGGHLSAAAMLDAVRKKITAFTQNAPQHDDMTAVLVKLIS
jgi:hypothetical protein